MRIIDYKAGGSHLMPRDLQEGRRLQLPLYALAAEQNFNGRVTSGFYWKILAGEAGSLRLERFEQLKLRDTWEPDTHEGSLIQLQNTNQRQDDLQGSEGLDERDERSRDDRPAYSDITRDPVHFKLIGQIDISRFGGLDPDTFTCPNEVNVFVKRSPLKCHTTHCFR